jgi:hypothetical protein
MWIFDSYYKGCVELWSRERGLNRTSSAYPPSFYMHLKDPHSHWDMIEGLKSRYRVEECSFNTIFGKFEGHKIYASRKVAEKIETPNPRRPLGACHRVQAWPRPKLDYKPELEGGIALEFHTALLSRGLQASPDAESLARLPSAFGFVPRHVPTVY